MNAHLITINRPASFTSVLNGLVTGAFTLALIGSAGVLTFVQYIAVA